MTTKIAYSNIAASTLAVLGGPKIATIAYPGTETATDTQGGETITLTGTGFNAGASVIINGQTAGVVTVISSTQATFTAPAQAAGTYPVYLVNSDGGTAIAVPGLSYSGVPAWTTAAGTIGTQYETTAVSQQLVATGDGSLTYSLVSGTLPTGTTLSSAGLLSGTAPAAASSTTYTFTVRVLDAQNQPTNRQFSLTVNPDVVTWSSPASGSTNLLSLEQTGTLNLVATSAAGKSITYTADQLPAGMAISGSNITGTPTQAGSSSSTITATAANTGKTAQLTFSWTVSLAVDQYFKYTTLLLNAETSALPFNADSSNNNFAITASGDTQASNFGPYQGSYYSNKFNGTSGYLEISSSTEFAFGTGDFTVEAWIYPLAYDGSIVGSAIFGTTGGGSTGYSLNLGESQDRMRILSNASGTWADNLVVSAGGGAPLNTWSHIAWVRNGNSMTIYKNGISVATMTGVSAYNFTSPSNKGYVGFWWDGSSTRYFNGHISNLRVVKGTALYTSNFTPNTTPLTAVTNTALLTCQSNRFLDNSNNAFTLTAFGSPQVSSFIPFVPSSTYSTYGSAYFDGSGDYLTVPTNSVLNFSSGDFTIEAWINPANLSADWFIISATGSGGLFFGNKTPGGFGYGRSAVAWDYNAGTITPNVWQHVALTRSDTSIRIFINGIQQGTTQTSSQAYDLGATSATIGSQGANLYFPGYISNLRVIKGTAVYTSNFTPPTQPLTAITNTSLLTLQTNQAVQNNIVVDASTNNYQITRNGNVTQGTFAPYGSNWSTYFPGSTSNYIKVGSQATVFPTSANYTIEGWFNISVMSSTVGLACFGDLFQMYIDSSGTSLTTQFRHSIGPAWAVNTSAFTFTVGTWYHIAAVLNSGSLRCYVNGTAIGSATTGVGNSAWGASGFDNVLIGVNDVYTYGSPDSYLNGYVSNFRVTKSAVYTSNFTPSTTPLVPLADTTLLTCQAPTFTDVSYNASAVTVTGTPSVQRFSPFNNVSQTPTTYATKFNGSVNDYIDVASNAVLGYGTGDFEISFWYYATSASGYLFDQRTTQPQVAPVIYYDSGSIVYYNSGGIAITGTNPSKNTWHYLTLSRVSGTTRLFVDGTQLGSNYTDSSNYGTLPLRIGCRFTTTSDIPYSGYISNFRIIKGTGVTYQTVPTSPLTAISGTSLLTCQDATIKDNSANKFAITATGSPTPKCFNPFGYTNSAAQSYDPTVYGGSMYMDGTGDYLAFGTKASTAVNALATNKYVTYEFWINTQTIQAITGYTSAFMGHAPGIYQDSRWMIELMGSSTTSTQTVMWWWTTSSGYADAVTSTTPLIQKSWNHIAITLDMTTPSSTTVKIYTNGIAETFTGKNLSSHSADNGNPCHFGAVYGGTDQSITAYVSDFRFTKDLVYTSNFVPPQAPLTAIKNTTVLLSGTNTGVRDASMQNVLETVGDAKITTVQKKYGTSSLYFDGSGDYFNIPNNKLVNFGTGDYTIEAWVYPTAISGDQYVFSFQAGGTHWSINIYQSNWRVGYGLSAGGISATSALNTWTHVAVCKSSGTQRFYINGSLASSVADTNTITPDGTVYVGAYSFTPANYWAGYIDDLRITKGYARYTGNFTPPTAALLVK